MIKYCNDRLYQIVVQMYAPTLTSIRYLICTEDKNFSYLMNKPTMFWTYFTYDL